MVVKSVEVDISVTGDAESKAKLDAIDAKAEALKKAFPTYALKIDSAAATSKLQIFRADLKSVADAAAKPVEVQLLSAKAVKTLEDIRLRAEKLKATFPEFTAKIDDTAYKAKLAAMTAEAKVTGDIISRELSGGGGGNLGGGAAGAGESGLGSIGPVPLPALLAIVPALGAALVELTGLVSGFAAATAGAGSFALLAAPAVKKVETAYTNLNTAQQAYQTAQAKESVAPSTANAKAVTTALDNLKAQQKLLSELPATEQAAVTGIQGLVTEFGKLSTAFQPEAFKVFSAGLQLVDKLLPDIVPFAKTFADVMTTLLTQAGKFTQTKGFTDFLAQFRGIEGPALTAIGDGIGKVTIAFGKLITTMSGKDVAQTIGIAFNTIAGILDGVSFVVKRLMDNWDGMSAAAKTVTHDVASVFDTLRGDTITAFHDMAGAVLQYGIIMVQAAKTITGTFLNMVGNIINGAAKAFGWIPGLGGKLRGAAADFSTWRTGVNSDFDKVIAKMQAWQNGLNAAKNTSATATQAISKNFTGVGTDANTTTGKVNALNTALTRLPKNVSVNLTETGTGNFTITQGTSGHAGGTPTGGRPGAAAGLFIATGTGPTADDVLIRASRGELVVPAHMVAGGFVDHLKGLIPGFASGGSIGALGPATTSFNDRFIASVTAAMEKAMTTAMKAAVAAATAAAAAVSAAAGGTAGAGVQQWKGTVLQALKLLGLPASLLNDVLYQMQTESGGNPTIVNKTDSNWIAGHPSVGLMQVIAGTFAQYAGPYRGTGPFEYGVSTNPLANIYAALNYGKHGAGFGSGAGQIGSGHGYDQGGWLQPGLTLAYNGTGRPERVTSGGADDPLAARLDRLIAEVHALTGVAASIPRATGQHVGAAVNGAAAAASFRVRYP